MDAEGAIPDPALVVLVGPAGSGKSAWASGRYRNSEVVPSDRLRGVVARVRRGLTTVVDTLGLDQARRRGYLELARRHEMPAVAVLFTTGPALALQHRDGVAPSRPSPAPAPASFTAGSAGRRRARRRPGATGAARPCGAGR
jgi:predicted kinase